MDVLVYMPAVLFPGGVAISEPLVPVVRDGDIKAEDTETPFEVAQRAFALAKGYELYKRTAVFSPPLGSTTG